MLAKGLLSFLRFWSVQIDVFEYCVNRVKTRRGLNQNQRTYESNPPEPNQSFPSSGVSQDSARDNQERKNGSKQGRWVAT